MPQERHRNKIVYYRGQCQPPMTQQALATLMNTTPKTIQAWEGKGVASEYKLLCLLRVFVNQGIITNEKKAIEFWCASGKQDWCIPVELAELFNAPHQQNSTSLDSHQPTQELHDIQQMDSIVDTSFVSLVSAKTPYSTSLPALAVAAPVPTMLEAIRTEQVVPGFHLQNTQPRFVLLQRLSPKQRAIMIGVSMLILAVFSFFIVQPNQAPVIPQRGRIAFATNGSLSSAFVFHQNRSFYSQYKVDQTTNTLVITAGPRTDQHETDVSAPLVTLPVAGDFDATVHAEVRFLGPFCCQHVGIGVRSPADPTTWIRITRDHDKKLTVNGNHGEAHITTHNIITASSLDLHIQRNGNRFSFFYRESGTPWMSFGEPLKFDLSHDAELFLVVYSAHNDQTSAGAFRDLVVR